MKRLSEVCKIVGVSRRTLQEYDKIGLLCPTKKTEGGYWLYDDDAIKILMTILVFIEVGYKRKEVKLLLEKPRLDVSLEFDKVIAMLEAKRKRLDGMIRMMQSNKAMLLLPKKALLAISKMDVSSILGTSSFVDRWNESVNYLSNEVEPSSEFEQIIGKLLFALGLLKDRPVDDLAVVECSKKLFDITVEEIIKGVREEDETEIDILPSDIALVFCEEIDDIPLSALFDENVPDEHFCQFWEEALPFIVRALKYYCKTVIKEVEGTPYEEVNYKNE